MLFLACFFILFPVIADTFAFYVLEYFLVTGYFFVTKTTVVLLLSEVAAMLSAILTALLTTLSGHSLSYYARPYLVIPLFYTPAMLSMGAVQYWWKKKVLLLKLLSLK